MSSYMIHPKNSGFPPIKEHKRVNNDKNMNNENISLNSNEIITTWYDELHEKIIEIEQQIKTQVDLRNKELEATINKTVNDQLKELQETLLKEVATMIINILTSQMILLNDNMTKVILQAIFQNQNLANRIPSNPSNQIQFLTPTEKPSSTTAIITPVKRLQ